MESSISIIDDILDSSMALCGFPAACSSKYTSRRVASVLSRLHNVDSKAVEKNNKIKKPYLRFAGWDIKTPCIIHPGKSYPSATQVRSLKIRCNLLKENNNKILYLW